MNHGWTVPAIRFHHRNKNLDSALDSSWFPLITMPRFRTQTVSYVDSRRHTREISEHWRKGHTQGSFNPLREHIALPYHLFPFEVIAVDPSSGIKGKTVLWV